MSVQPNDPHFELLAAEYFDEVLDQAGHDELKSLLQEDDRRVKRFAQLAQLDQVINSEIAYHHEAKRFGLSSASSESGAASALVELASLYEDGLQDPMNFAVFREERAKKASADRRKQWLNRTLISGGLAAALLLAVTLLAAVFTGNPPDTQVADQQPNDPETTDPLVPAIPSRAVATLTNTHNAKWSPPQAEGASAPVSHPSVGSPLHAGTRLTLTAGFAQITTHRGAIAIVEAPATIELLDNDNAIELHSGKLVGICETESSKGFLVRTPQIDVIDLGTRFGVDASSPNSTEAHVFEGEVQVTRQSSFGSSAVVELLSAGQAVVATRQGPGLTRIACIDSAFVTAMPARHLPEGTGFGLAVGQIDPNWQIVAINDQPLDQPRSLSRVDVYPQDSMQVPDSMASWIARDTAKDPEGELRGSIPYVIRGTITIPESFDPATVRLSLRYLVDDHIAAIRLNGQPVPLKNPARLRLGKIATESIAGPFVAGQNTIEFEIINGQSNPYQNFVGLIADWQLEQQPVP